MSERFKIVDGTVISYKGFLKNRRMWSLLIYIKFFILDL